MTDRERTEKVRWDQQGQLAKGLIDLAKEERLSWRPSTNVPPLWSIKESNSIIRCGQGGAATWNEGQP